jgi:hypothetical protein
MGARPSRPLTRSRDPCRPRTAAGASKRSTAAANYRLIHAGNVIDGFFIAILRRLLKHVGTELASLIDAP